jgi:hypothetical protein
MKLRNLIAPAVALALVLTACGDNKKSTDTTSNTISTSDGPGEAGPPVPTSAGETTSSTAPAASGRQIAAPWPAPTSKVAQLIKKAGLPALPGERLEYHVHSHLDVFVDGKAQAVPANLGIDVVESVISPLHTHDETGLIHVENATPATFYLGQLFVEWDIRLDTTCAGTYCRPTKDWTIYVDGTKDTRDPSKIEFAAHREIAIVIGTPPSSIPKKYDFPANT